MSKFISLHEPNFSGNEWKYVKECLDTSWVSSSGKYVFKFEKKIARYTGAKYAIACINATSALQISLRILGVSHGDEVIAPSFTFIAPINAIYYNGAHPVFMDADKYHNLDSVKTLEFIKKQTYFKNGFTINKKTKRKIKALIPVHVWGNAVQLDELIKLCKERNISILEDASESLGTMYLYGKYKKRHTGTIGDIGCISFNGNKIITTGGGGVILTNNSNLAKKAFYLSNQAKDDETYYIHNEIGYNFRLSNLQAAIGLAQLEKISKFIKNKKKIHEYYNIKINSIDGLNILKTPDYARNNFWFNILEINSKKFKKKKKEILKSFHKKNIQARSVWCPIHLQKPYIKNQKYKIYKSNNIYKNSICLPSSSQLTKKKIEFIIKTINE
tara:strand:+ start:2100 stop:3260 length:1161 start_codon:yes stop_codon:yes gene_type:complete